MKTGRRVGIGDSIEIKVDSVEAPRGRVDLIAAGERTPREKGSTRGRSSGPKGRNRSSKTPGGRK
jgi:hypothetical protein